jgi:putative methionine-R-sulfoxide reductase with GAF domain
VGADILAAIDFPYPVVPIVRHHHENWDGTGYPAKLRGTDIPIGARILAVVDCFDALTSDRPYRPRLTKDQALSILLERRATMYDPLIVDTFIRVHNEITPEPQRSALADVENEITPFKDSVDFVVNDEGSESADERLAVHELAYELASQATVHDSGCVVTRHVQRLVPCSLCVVYLYDAATDELRAGVAAGAASATVQALRIRLGERLSGWVAVNRQTIMNSDAALDLGEFASGLQPRLQSSLSTPLVSGTDLVGVLAVYRAQGDGFTVDDRRVIEIVGRQIAPSLKRAIEFDKRLRRDDWVGLQNAGASTHRSSHAQPFA